MDDDVVAALRDQLQELRSMVEGRDEADLAKPSACAGWSVSDVLLHLAQTNEMAVASVVGGPMEPGGPWQPLEDATSVDDLADRAVAVERGPDGAAVRERWDASAVAMQRAFESVAPDARVLWVMGDMAARSLATTRLAETWIHTGDIAAGLGVEPTPSDRIWHICRLVHRTIPYAFSRACLTPPGPVRFELTAPEAPDRTWSFGDESAATVVTGPALDLCRVAGQRAPAAATALRGSGPGAEDVLAVIRTFA